MNVAIVHDWLTGMRGGERLLEVICRIFPDAPIFTLFHHSGSVSPLIESHPVIASRLSRILPKKKWYRQLLPMFPWAIENFDLQGFDLVISTSHAVAKGVIVPGHALSVCYCHTPMRYIWDRYDDYFGPASPSVIRYTAAMFRDYLREWDVSSSMRVDYFIANSRFVADRIRALYSRPATIIHPPVDMEFFHPNGEAPEDFYLMVSAFAPYKKIELAIAAFSQMKKRLVIIGPNAGRQIQRTMSKSSWIDYLGALTDEDVRDYYQRCRALIFPGIEDFGLTPLEAQGCGRPVIGFAEGGLLETMIEGVTGHYFKEQTVPALIQAVEKFESMIFDPAVIRKRALTFHHPSTEYQLRRYLTQLCQNHGLPWDTKGTVC